MQDLPADVYLCILRQLRGWDLVAASRACAAWSRIIAKEQMWRRACEYRWRHIFADAHHTDHTGSGGIESPTPPLQMPKWVRRDFPFRWKFAFASPHPQLLPPPRPGAPQSAWRAYFLEHDMYEAMNLSPAFLSPEEQEELANEIIAALRWCSPLFGSAVAELPWAFELIGSFQHLRKLSLAHAARTPSLAVALPHIDGLIHSGGSPERASLDRLTSLWLVDTSLDSRDLERVLLLLQHGKMQLQDLDLSGNLLGAHGAGLIASAMQGCNALNGLRSLGLADAEIGDHGVKRLCAALREHKSITSLNLAQNSISHVGAEHIARWLSNSDVLPYLATGVADAAADDANAPPAAAAQPPLSGEPAPALMEVDSPLATAITSRPQRLQVLNLSFNPLGAGGVLAIAQSLQPDTVVGELVMQYVNLHPTEGDSRLEPFPLMPLLTDNSILQLDLGHNFIAACGHQVDRLREALAANTKLRSISLRRCCIGGWRRARAIARGLALNTSLTKVDLSYNGIGAAAQAGAGIDGKSLSLAVEALCHALRDNRQLRWLGLAHNGLGDGGAGAIVQSVILSESMVKLDLRSNGVSISKLRELCGILASAGARWLPEAVRWPQSLGRLSPEPRTQLRTARLLCPVAGSGLQPGGAGRLTVDLRGNATLEALLKEHEAPVLEEVDVSGTSRRMSEGSRPSPLPPSEVPPPVRTPASNTPSAMEVTQPTPTSSAAGASAAASGADTVGDVACSPAAPSKSAASSRFGNEHWSDGDEGEDGEEVEDELPAQRGWRQRLATPCPYYMQRQPEISAQMRRILVEWLIELYEELQLPVEVLLRGVHYVDRFLSVEAVDKEALQLVGAVALMVSSNNFCKLPMQDGEPMPGDRGLTTAEDIVYWTDGTYSIDEVLRMEAQLLQGLDPSGFTSPLDFLTAFCSAVVFTDSAVSIALELLVISTREYGVLKLHPCLLAACCLYVAVRNAPDGSGKWDDAMSACCGYPKETLTEHIEETLDFMNELELTCRSVGSGNRHKTIKLVLMT